MSRTKSTVIWGIAAVLVGAGCFYLDSQGVDWRKQAAALDEWFSAPPPVLTNAEQQVQTPGSKALAPSFDVATVDGAGRLVAAGRGEAGWTIRLQSKDATVGEAKADENNEWVLTLDRPLPPGEHKLSLLGVDPTGRQMLAGKREITLSVLPREASAAKSSPSAASVANSVVAPSETPKPEAEKDKCALTVVKKGDSLWEIARRCYGDGSKYTRIHDTNRPMISDPNLIYPDQKFSVPH
jgi:LysM repeat protein